MFEITAIRSIIHSPRQWAVTFGTAIAIAGIATGAMAAPKHAAVPLASRSVYRRSASNLSLTLPPPTIEPQESLIYRQANQPIGEHNGAAFWLMGDSQAGSITVYFLASGGHASDPLPVPGSGHDNEPLWPAWISKPISTNFSGWHRILISSADMTYRTPDGVDPASPAVPLNTADTFGIASDKTDGTIYVDNLVWANVDNDGNATGDSSVIDDLSSGSVAGWRVKGSPEAVSFLIPGVTSLQPYVKDDTVSLKLDYSALDASRKIETRGVARSIQQSGKDYLVSVPSSPFERILPDSLPTTSEISSRVTLTECSEQTGCGSFAIYSLHGLTNVRVHLTTSLYAIGTSIPQSSVNISVVKVWHRRGKGVYVDPDSAGPTPELLVKDDRVPLSYVDGQPPDVRLTGDVATDIPANTEKQFWIDVTVPRNTPPGQYTGQILVKSTEAAPFKLTLETDVLPLRLLSPAKQYAINYRGKIGTNTLSDDLPCDHVTAPQMSSELADIAAHGFHYVSLSDAPDSLSQTLTTEQQFNFQSPLVYPVSSGLDGLATAEAIDKNGGDPSQYYYLVPSGSTMVDDIARLKKAGFQTAALIDSQSDYDAVQNDLDVAIYPVDYSYVQRLLSNDGQRQSSIRDWLTWPAAQDDPQVDRLYCGYLLWRADLYGGYVSDYETSYDSDPFNDASPPVDPSDSMLRPAMLTYPAQQGVIDTVQWEAIREGINDVRYLTTFYTALRECKDAKIDLVLIGKAQTDVTNFLNSAFWLMSDSDYQKGRMMITNYALQLRKAVDNYNTHQNGASRQSSSFQVKKGKSG